MQFQVSLSMVPLYILDSSEKVTHDITLALFFVPIFYRRSCIHHNTEVMLGSNLWIQLIFGLGLRLQCLCRSGQYGQVSDQYFGIILLLTDKAFLTGFIQYDALLFLVNDYCF